MKVHGDKLMYVMSFNKKLSTIFVLQLVYKMVPLAAEVVERLDIGKVSICGRLFKLLRSKLYGPQA